LGLQIYGKKLKYQIFLSIFAFMKQLFHKVSVVIVCMNRPDNLYPCLNSIITHTKTECEIFVVAYMYDKEKLQEAGIKYPQVTFIESDEIRGFSENNNLALRQATGDYTFILNDDTEFDTDVISALANDLANLPEDAAIVAPTLRNSDGTLQLRGRPDYPARDYLLQQWHLHKEPIDNGSGLFRTFNISGAAFLIKTDIFRQLGWFDERYFFTPEDIALSTLCRKKGFSVWCDGNVNITHKWRTTASRIAPAIRPAAVRGSLIFFSRGSKTKYALLGAGVWLSETLKMLKAKFTGRTEDFKTFRNIKNGIFSNLSPKELFITNYHNL